jgi:Ca2+-binding EF-hand superfamily protein
VLRYIFKSNKDDNQLDFSEYLIAISVITRGGWKEKLKMSFEIFDLDKNGTIDQNEMKGILEAVYDISGADRQGDNSPTTRVKNIMKQLDINNDGILNIDEFISGCMNDPNLRTLFAPIIK